MRMQGFAARVATGTVAGMVGVTLMVTAGTAGAAKRDVVGDATGICAGVELPDNLAGACELLAATQDEAVTTFSGKPREGAQNLEAQSRRSASVVLSLDDVYTRNKIPGQVQPAIDDACAYAAKSDELLAVGKVAYAGDDLGAVARELAAAIYAEFAGEYGDVITNPCPI